MPKKDDKKPNAKRIRKLFRFTENDWKRIEANAKSFAGGNATKWVTHGALTGEKRRIA